MVDRLLNPYTNPITPEQRALSMMLGGYTDYGIPMMTSPTSQLGLLQDVQSMAFDTVFMFNQGLITPEQLLRSIRNATSEPVGQPEEYDLTSMENAINATADKNLIDAMNQIKYNGMTAAGAARWLRTNNADTAGQLTDVMSDNINSIEKQLEKYETVFNNNKLLMERTASGEWFIDPETGVPMRSLTGEAARENLRASGWKGVFAEPEFWKTVPDAQTMEMAAKLQEQFQPIFDQYEADRKPVGEKTMEEIAKTSSSTKKLIEAQKAKGIDISQNVRQTTAGWKRIEDAYNAALKDFISPQNSQAMGFEDLGSVGGYRVVIRKENNAFKSYSYDSSGKLMRVSKPLTQNELDSLRSQSLDRKQHPEKYKQDMKLGYVGNLHLVTEGGKTYLETQINGRTTSRTPIRSSSPQPAPPGKASQDYAARQAAYYTAKAMGEERKALEKKAAEGKAQVEAKVSEAQKKGTTPALEWMRMLPQIAALVAQPAPEMPKASGKAAPRVLSDEEINSMATMIAGGLA